MDLLIIFLIVYMLKNAVIDAKYAAQGKASPRWEAKLERLKQAGKSGTKPRYGSKDWFADLVSDGLAAQTERRRTRATKAKTGELDAAVDEALAVAKPEPTPNFIIEFDHEEDHPAVPAQSGPELHREVQVPDVNSLDFGKVMHPCHICGSLTKLTDPRSPIFRSLADPEPKPMCTRCAHARTWHAYAKLIEGPVSRTCANKLCGKGTPVPDSRPDDLCLDCMPMSRRAELFNSVLETPDQLKARLLAPESSRPDAQIIPMFPVKKEVPTMSEITGLQSAIAYAEGVAAAHEQHSIAGGEAYRGSLQGFGVSGQAIQVVASAQEFSEMAASAWRAAAAELSKQNVVKEAYDSVPDAGSKAFVQGE